MGRAGKKAMISDIAGACGVSMADTEKIITAYCDAVTERTEYYVKQQEPRQFGIMALDALLQLYPGFVVIYGNESSGKTALVKSIAITALRDHLHVLFHDAENKLFKHQTEVLQGALLANSTRIQGLDEWIHSRLLDLVIVDTITALMPQSAGLLLHKLKGSVSYNIIVTQMRTDIARHKSVPACQDILLGWAHTHLYLTEIEKITIFGIDMKRVHFVVSKYSPDYTRQGKRGSYIIRNGRVDELFTALDVLRTRGRFSSRGPVRYLDNIAMGSQKEIMANNDMQHKIEQEAREELYADAGIIMPDVCNTETASAGNDRT